jgi:hypothetical protein
MVTAMRVAGNKEGEGGKAMAMAARVVGKWTAKATKTAMAMKTREVGKEEGNGKGSKSDDDGKEEGDSKEDGDVIFSSNFYSYVKPVQSNFLYVHRKTNSNNLACHIGTH